LAAYILRRILLIIPTMLGIMLVTFIIVQFAPGGPVERLIAQLAGTDPGATAKFSGGGGDFSGTGGGQQGMPGDVSAAPSKYRGAQGLDPWA
jgi:microcin C transport system permease protein